MQTFLNSASSLWQGILILKLVIVVTYVLFWHLELVNTVLFFGPAWISMALIVEFIYLLQQKLKQPEKTRTFGAGWFVWIFILIVNIGIALFFFNPFWFAAVYALVPLSAGYLAYTYRLIYR